MTPVIMLNRALFASLLLGVVAANVSAFPLLDAPKTRKDLVQEVLSLTNVERAKFKLPALTYEPRLEKAAQWMAEDMALNHYFAHVDSMDRSIGQRVPSFGYTNYQTLRENIAAGYPTAAQVVEGWMNSPSHRKAILCDKVKHLGVGFYFDEESKYKWYWVQEFGREL